MRPICDVGENVTVKTILSMSSGGGGAKGSAIKDFGIILKIGDDIVRFPMAHHSDDLFIATLKQNEIYDLKNKYEVVTTNSDDYLQALSIEEHQQNCVIEAKQSKGYVVSESLPPAISVVTDMSETVSENSHLIRIHIAPMQHRDKPSGMYVNIQDDLVFAYTSQAVVNAVDQMQITNITQMSQGWLQAHKNLHIIRGFDSNGFDSVVSLDKESVSGYITTKKSCKKRSLSSPINLEAATYGAYQVDELSISWFLNAILNEDHPNRVHVLVDIQEDILIAVYNFFKRYAHLIQGKLVFYKSEISDEINTDTNRSIMSSISITLCQWQRSLDLSEDGLDFFTLASSDEFPATLDSFQKIAEHVHHYFETIGVVVADNSSVIRGTRIHAIDWLQSYQLVSMANAIILAVEQIVPDKNKRGELLPKDHMVKAYLLRFECELQAAHFRLRHNGESGLQLPEGLGHIIVMAAMTTRKIHQEIFRLWVSLSEATILKEFLQFFPCSNIKETLKKLLISEELIMHSSRAYSSQRKVSQRFHSTQSVVPAISLSGVEMKETVDETESTLDIVLANLDAIDVRESINNWSELTLWLHSLDIEPAHFKQYMSLSAEFINLGENSISLIRPIQKILQRYYIQTNGGSRIIFKSFGIAKDEIYDCKDEATILVNGHPTFVWMVPQRREDGFGPKVYEIADELDQQSRPTCAIIFPVDASAETQRRWRGFGSNTTRELRTSRKALQAQFSDTYLTEDHFGDNLCLSADDWMVKVARKLLPEFVSFKDSANGQEFFVDLALLLDLPNEVERLYTVQNMWQIMLQALETGWPQMMVTIPSGHNVEWYEKLYNLCKTTIFIKPECRGLVRAYTQIDIQTMMTSTHEQCVFRQDSEPSLLDRFNGMFGRDTTAEPQNYVPALVDSLVGRFAQLNPTMHTSSRLVTTPEQIASFLQEMVANIVIAAGDIKTCKARQYGLALYQLCALPLMNGSAVEITKEVIIQHANLGIARLICQIEDLVLFSEQFNACQAFMRSYLPKSHALIEGEINLTGVFDIINLLFNINADIKGVDFFRNTTLSHPILFSLFEYYIQPTTMPNMLGDDRDKDGKRIEIANPNIYESTPDLFSKLIRDLIKSGLGSSRHQKIMYAILNLVLLFPFNVYNNTNKRSPEKLGAAVDAEASFNDLQIRIESLLLIGHLSPVEMHAFYKIVNIYYQDYLNDYTKFSKIIYNKTYKIFSLFDRDTFSYLDKNARAESISILFKIIQAYLPESQVEVIIDGVSDATRSCRTTSLALRNQWRTTRLSSHYYICAGKNWKEFFERVALRYFDRRIPETRLEWAHQWWELILNALPPISAGLGLQVLNEMEAFVLGNSTTAATTAMVADSVTGKLNRFIAIMCIVLGSLVFAERVAATVGLFPKKIVDARLWRHATWALELILTGTAIGAALALTLLNDGDPDLYYLGNLSICMCKAYSGSFMVAHSNGFAKLISPLLMVAGCTPTFKRILKTSSRILIFMALLSFGGLLSINPIDSAMFDIGGYSQPLIFALEAAANFLNSVLSTTIAIFFSLGIGTAFIFSSYRIPTAYKVFASLVFFMGFGLVGVSVASFAVQLSDYISGAATQIPEWVAFVVAHSNVLVWGTLSSAALMIVIMIAIVECMQIEKAPSYFLSKVSCCINTKLKERCRSSTGITASLLKSSISQKGIRGFPENKDNTLSLRL